MFLKCCLVWTNLLAYVVDMDYLSMLGSIPSLITYLLLNPLVFYKPLRLPRDLTGSLEIVYIIKDVLINSLQ